MESKSIFRKIVDITHFPTVLLIIGYPVYWVELYFFHHPLGRTSFLAVFLALVFFLQMSISQVSDLKMGLKEWIFRIKTLQKWQKIFLVFGFLLVLIILGIALKAALYPPHLVQESDALNYHITLPRQHLLRGSFAHIRWSSADLYYMPLQYALAPYWLCTELPNKIPQFVFLLGFLLIVGRLVSRYTENNIIKVSVSIFAVIGSHAFGIQLGTAMLDIVICYLFFAFIDSLLSGDYFLAIIEFAFFFWSKPFMPVQTCGIIVVLFVVAYAFKFCGFSIENVLLRCQFSSSSTNNKNIDMKRMLIWFLILSVFVGGPFVYKSLDSAATPLFPLSPGAIKIKHDIDYSSNHWKSIKDVAQRTRETKDAYGYERDWKSFVQHFWLIAVPDKGVNNRFDYPLGLPYLLFLGPFFVLVWNDIRKRKLEAVSVFIIIYWFSWWLGIHQSRFLFIPLTSIFIYVLIEKKRMSRVLCLGLILSLIFVAISMYRNHKDTFSKNYKQVLRKKDLDLIKREKNIRAGEVIEVDFFDVAYAISPVKVVGNSSIFVFKE